MRLRLEDEPEAAAATNRMLVLDDTKAFFTFVDVDEPPVLSLLRGFSAPVCLVDGLGDAELVILLRHDSDPFNRWEAGQRLALGRLLAAVAGDVEAPLDAAFVEAMRAVLREPSLDPAFKALVLTPPSEIYIAEQLDSVDPQRVHAAREAMKRQLATALVDDWQWAFEAHQVGGGYSPDPVSSRPARAGQPRPDDALPGGAAERRRGLAGPRLAALQGRRQHDRPPGRADGADGLGLGARRCRRSSASTRSSGTTRWCSTSGSRCRPARRSTRARCSSG